MAGYDANEVMVDWRCPCCNGILNGGPVEVGHRKESAIPKVIKCYSCDNRATLSSDSDMVAGFKHVWYTTGVKSFKTV